MARNAAISLPLRCLPQCQCAIYCIYLLLEETVKYPTQASLPYRPTYRIQRWQSLFAIEAVLLLLLSLLYFSTRHNSATTLLQTMVLLKFSLLCWLLLSSVMILLTNCPVKCDDDEKDNLYQGINKYRASLNLKALIKNKNADCLADEIADQFKNQPCTNTTGANTIPGTEPQFPNYPNLLAKCHLAISNTRDGTVMPACVPGLLPSLVLTNFTKSLYSENLNDTKYTGIGIGSEDNWIVVVLTTDTPAGTFSPYSSNGARLISKVGLIYFSMLLLVSKILLF